MKKRKTGVWLWAGRAGIEPGVDIRGFCPRLHDPCNSLSLSLSSAVEGHSSHLLVFTRFPLCAREAHALLGPVGVSFSHSSRDQIWLLEEQRDDSPLHNATTFRRDESVLAPLRKLIPVIPKVQTRLHTSRLNTVVTLSNSLWALQQIDDFLCIRFHPVAHDHIMILQIGLRLR